MIAVWSPVIRVSPFYDPMLAKIIASGPDRETARRRLVRALEDTVLFGVTTNRQFLIDVLQRDDFVSGNATTAFISENFSETDLTENVLSDREAAIAAIVQHVRNREFHAAHIPSQLLGWFSAAPLSTPYIYDDKRVEVTSFSAEHFQATIAGKTFDSHLLTSDKQSLTLTCEGCGRESAYFQRTLRTFISRSGCVNFI